MEAPEVRVRVRLHCVQKVLSVERQYILCRETMSSPSFPAKIKNQRKIDSSELRGTLGVRLRVLRGVVTTLS